MSGVSLDARYRGDRGPCWCPQRALTLMEWRSRGLRVPFHARESACRRAVEGAMSLPRYEWKKIAAQDLWVCG